MGPEPLEETIDMALDAVYMKISEFLNEGNRKIITYDAITIKLRKRVAEEFGLPAVARLLVAGIGKIFPDFLIAGLKFVFI